MDFLKDMGINCFPVVYTTADPAHVHPTSMHANGVYFSAGDLFAFVQKLGPLRLNILIWAIWEPAARKNTSSHGPRGPTP